MKTQQTEQQAEAIGYAEASGQFKTQGAFSSGQTHSPLPWHTSPDNLAILSGDRNDPEIVAQLAMDDVMAIQRLDEVEANAAFIVRACSNFDNMEKGIAILQATIDTHQGTIDSLCDQLLESRNNAQRLADALKNLRQTSGTCLDDIRAFGSIKPMNGSNYRKANEETIEALAQWESKQ